MGRGGSARRRAGRGGDRSIDRSFVRSRGARAFVGFRAGEINRDRRARRAGLPPRRRRRRRRERRANGGQTHPLLELTALELQQRLGVARHGVRCPAARRSQCWAAIDNAAPVASAGSARQAAQRISDHAFRGFCRFLFIPREIDPSLPPRDLGTRTRRTHVAAVDLNRARARDRTSVTSRVVVARTLRAEASQETA